MKKEKGISFTEIAERAAQIGKEKLAMLLLAEEQNLSKKIPTLLSMKQYKVAL